MEKVVLLALLICPVMMGVMVVLMWRGMRAGKSESPEPQNLVMEARAAARGSGARVTVATLRRRS